MSNGESLPDYDLQLRLYHEAFEAEIINAIQDLPLPETAKVLDVPCGDGFYSLLLAERIGRQGEVIGADLRPAYLQRSRDAAAAASREMEFVHANAYQLPFPDGAFDAVWCAQSFVSLDAPLTALREFRRVLKPEGFVAILENDDFHHLLLPWPARLEVQLQVALQQACLEKYGSPEKNYVSRKMRRWLLAAGFSAVERKSYTADRQVPLSETDRKFLEVYLKDLRSFVSDYLADHDRDLFERLAEPACDEYLGRQDDFELTCLFSVWRAQR